MNFENQEIVFPVDWTYRIIVESSKADTVVKEITGLMQQLGVRDDLKLANKSSSGKYTTYSFSKQLASKKEMENIANTIHSLDGVKVVI